MNIMAEKISTIILTVDLECCKCYKKIRKVLCQLQEQHRKVKPERDPVCACGPVCRCRPCEPVEPVPVVPTPEPVLVCASGPVCCRRPCPCYDHAYHGRPRCCSCGMVYVFGDGPPPVVYGAKPCYDGFSTFFVEDQPSLCTIM